MEEYLIPTRTAQAEFVEKRSTFIGHVWPVDSEEQARAHIEEMKKKYHDARHNCWCYLIKDGPVRYSDDGEPQGTAGQPMLAVFQKEGVTNACCVVTRYFGGVLLGALFMASDYATSPATPGGQVLYGIGCGVLTVLFRSVGLYPEGVTYAILLMNAASWLLERFTPTRLWPPDTR